MTDKPIQITELDRDRLKKLFEDATHTEYRGSDSLTRLQLRSTGRKSCCPMRCRRPLLQ